MKRGRGRLIICLIFPGHRRPPFVIKNWISNGKNGWAGRWRSRVPEGLKGSENTTLFAPRLCSKISLTMFDFYIFFSNEFKEIVEQALPESTLAARIRGTMCSAGEAASNGGQYFPPSQMPEDGADICLVLNLLLKQILLNIRSQP